MRNTVHPDYAKKTNHRMEINASLKKTDMLRFAANVNEYDFAGTLHEHPEVLTDPALSYWKQYERSSPFARYLTLILREDIVDALAEQLISPL